MANTIHYLEQAAKQAVALITATPANADSWQGVAAQFLQEKGWAFWDNGGEGTNYNIANVTNGGQENGFVDYPSLAAGVEGYAYALLHEGEGKTYENVVNAIKTGTAESVIEALSNSPWCLPPYPLATLQSVLSEVQAMSTTETTTKETVAQLEADIKNLEAELAAKQEQLKAAQAAVPAGEYVTVTASAPLNTLWGIAEKYLGNGNLWVKLIPLNPGVIPSALQAGQRIRVK